MTFLCFFLTKSNAQKASRAKLNGVEYPSYLTPDLLIEKFQTDLRNRRPGVVHGGWQTWLLWGAKKHNMTLTNFEAMLLSTKLRIKNFKRSELRNSGWRQEGYYDEVTVTSDNIPCFYFEDDPDDPLVKVASSETIKKKVRWG